MRKQGFRKLISAVLVIMMVISAAPALQAQAAERETNYFTDGEHAELTYAEMEAAYRRYDPTQFYADIERFTGLAAKEENTEQVKELYGKLEEEFEEVYTLLYLSNNALRRDAGNTKWSEEYMYTNDMMLKMYDSLCAALKKASALPGGKGLKDILGEELIKGLQSYEVMTEEQLARNQKEQELLLEYQNRQIAAAGMTVKINGKEWNDQDLLTAYLNQEIDAAAYSAATNELSAKRNEYLGEIYLRLVEHRKETAKAEGYGNYGDLRYAAYGRDYTQESIREFEDAVKEYIVDPYLELSYLQDGTAECLNREYPYQEVLGMMDLHIPEISSEMREALDYLQRNKLYNLDYSSTKLEGAYTCPLPSYGSGYIYSQPYGNAYDFSGTLVHEFGHFNAFYHNGMKWYSSLNLDIAEVHSQGLETLFLEFYDELFEEDAIRMKEFVTGNLLGAYVTGCLINELETYVYATDGVTLKDINRKFMELAKEYGIADESDPRTELYTWSSVPHIFQSPCYYISYATSVAAAFDIWELSTEDYDKAVDSYLKFTSLGFEHTFLETLQKAGLGNSLSAENVKKVGEKLTEYFCLDERMDIIYGGMTDTPPEEDGKADGKDEDKQTGKDTGKEAGKDTAKDTDKETGKETGKGSADQTKKDGKETGKETVVSSPVCHAREGDTLAVIGNRFKVDWKEIAKLNGLKSPYRIKAGDELKLPANAVIPKETYRVRAGDTLESIAKKLGMDWRILAKQLGLEAPYTIYAGELLTFTY